ncbi:MAG: zinc ribbon domain-containing protein [Acidithiobacillus sp.]|nr:zinc ribbon domain-containing protein [Acidithiobacillus sp.]
MSKFCSECGADVDESAKFCGSCGANIQGQPLPADDHSTPVDGPKAQKSAASGSMDAGNILVIMAIGSIFFSFISPLLGMLLYQDKNSLVVNESKAMMNFQLTVILGFIVSFILSLLVIGFFLMGIVFIANLAVCILAAMAYSKGESYSYPYSLRLLK